MFDWARESIHDSIHDSNPALFTSSHVNRVNGFRIDSRDHNMKSNGEIPFMNRFKCVIEHTHFVCVCACVCLCVGVGVTHVRLFVCVCPPKMIFSRHAPYDFLAR